MADRHGSLHDLLAEALADDWQPGSLNINRLSYEERQQLEDGPDDDFIAEKLDEAQRRRKRASIAAGIGLTLCILFPPFFFGGSDWGTLAGVLWICAAFGLASFGALRHMHWRKRAMIYRAFRLLDSEHETPSVASASRNAPVTA